MATEDILINDGDSFVSLSALAAEQVDCNLPISDEKDTVKIWSAANDFINFDTGGTNDFKMDPSGNFTAKGKILSNAVGVANVAFSNNDNEGFAFITAGYPGIVSSGEQVQNWNYQVLPENSLGQTYQRYQAIVKARKGSSSYSELMFLSDDPTNIGLRFLSCGTDVEDVLGWPVNCGYDSSGVSAILYTGYEFLEGGRSGEYSPFIIGSTNNSDVCFIQNTFPFITLNAVENDIVLHVPLNQATVKNDFIVNKQIQTPSITGAVPASDVEIKLSNQATLTAGDGSEYVPSDSASIATKKIVDDKIWVGTTAAYQALSTKNPSTLYCLTD